MRPLQLDLFCKPSPEVIASIDRMCENGDRLRNVVTVGELIRITPLLNKYWKRTK